MDSTTCSVEGCEREPVTRGWCDMHYRRWKKNGDPLTLSHRPRVADLGPFKVCRECGLSLPLAGFYKAKGGGNYFRSLCRSCDSARAAEARLLVREKRCARCEEIRPASVFAHEATAPDGLYAYCMECRRKRKREDVFRRPPWYLRRCRSEAMKRSGLSYAELEARLQSQGGVCAICGGVNENERALSLDHDHETGLTRDFLCGGCNTGIGSFHDDPALLLAAAAYLKRWAISARPEAATLGGEARCR